MKIIVGLGNIGSEYVGTRHNFGFSSVEYLAEKFAATWKNKTKFSAEIAEANVGGEKVLFVKPTTFYNLSGVAVRAIRDFYNLTNDDILVIHDEMALPLGTLRARRGGQDAGNNGIKSLSQHIGNDFARVRIGSGKEYDQNGLLMPDSNHRDFVLSRPNATEQKKFDELLPKIEQIVKDFAQGEFAETTYKV
jgi:PTH1 family peptidyl-tRNA hydrolase